MARARNRLVNIFSAASIVEEKKKVFLFKNVSLGVVTHSFNSSTQLAETSRFL